MTRIVVILSLVFAAACDVGSVVGNNPGGPDGSITGGPDAPGSGSGSGSNCTPVQSANLPDGHHNAGQTCMTAGCHLIGNAGGPEFSYAGTIYRDAQGTNPFPGATISVTIAGAKHTAVSASNGNFFIPKALATPPTAGMTATTNASGCPSTAPMSNTLVDNGGNCNNCHRTGAGAQTTPIYLQ